MAVDPQTVLEKVLAELQAQKALTVAEANSLNTRKDHVDTVADEIDIRIDAIESALAALP